ncbi:MAG: hypothetical protein ACKOZM_03715, partial [Flavobacteriales bacterium]
MLRTIDLSALALILCIVLQQNLNAQTSQVQFIHNSSEPALSCVSVWMNNSLWIDSIAYHEATAMVTLPAADSIEWQIRSVADTNVSYYSWISSIAPNSKNIFTLHGHLQSTFQPSRPLA